MHWLRRSAAGLAAILSLWLVVASAAQQRLVLVGSGSNLPLHLYQVWIAKFNANNQHIQVQYLPVGSSEGLRQIADGVGDFAAGEIPLADPPLRGVKFSLLPIPTALVGVVPIYNLPGKPTLNFSGTLLAQMYLGTVRNWNDPRIARLNPGVELPDLPIRVVHRSPGKGTNYIFTSFLSKVDSRFRIVVGTSPSPSWPVGIEADRGQDMVDQVVSTRGAIGYVETSFVRNLEVGSGRVENAAGQFVAPTAASIAAACTTAENSHPGDFRHDITNAPGEGSYPISSFTWIYVPTSGTTADRRRALREFLMWSLQDGQSLAVTLGYAPMPARIRGAAVSAVLSLK